MKKSVGMLFIFYPLYSVIVMKLLKLEFFWYFSEYYVSINLAYSVFCFLAFSIGVFFLFEKAKYYLLSVFCFLFFCYQIFSWSFKGLNFTDKIELDDQTEVVISSQMGGAIGSDFVNIILSKEKWLLFVEHDTLLSLENASDGQIVAYDPKSKVLMFSYLSQGQDREVYKVDVSIY